MTLTIEDFTQKLERGKMIFYFGSKGTIDSVDDGFVWLELYDKSSLCLVGRSLSIKSLYEDFLKGKFKFIKSKYIGKKF